MSSDTKKPDTDSSSRRNLPSKTKVFVRSAGDVWGALSGGSFLVSPFITASELLSVSDYFGKRRLLISPPQPKPPTCDSESSTPAPPPPPPPPATEPITWTTKVVERSELRRSITWDTTPKTKDGLFAWRRDTLTVADLDKGADDRARCSVKWECQYRPTKAQLKVEAAALLAGDEPSTDASSAAGADSGAGAGAGAGSDESSAAPDTPKHPPLDLDILPYLLSKLGGSGVFTTLPLVPSPATPTAPSSTGVEETKTEDASATDVTTNTDASASSTSPPNVIPGLFEDDSDASVMALNPETNTFAPVPVTSLRPGQVVQVTSGDVFPADLLLVQSSAPTQTAVNQQPIDGSNALRLRQVKSVDVSVDGASRSFQSLWDGIGSGDPAVLAPIAGLGSLSVPPPAADGRFKLRLDLTAKSADGKDKKPIDFGTEQLLAAGAKLVMTESAVGVVVYVGNDTWFVKNEAKVNGVIRKRRHDVHSAAKKAWEKIEKTLSNQKPWKLPVLIAAAAYEAETGMKWDSKFTDVPDDGNCLMHAVWLGLTTLERLHPDLKLAGVDLPADPVAFRTMALDRMSEDATYRSSVDEQIRLWLSLDAALLMTAVEDFFVLPTSFQEEILSTNQAVSIGGFEGVDFSGLVTKYMDLQKQRQVINGRDTYLPLGEAELGALLRLFSFRLQTVKSEAIRESDSGEAGGAAGVDPRTIHPKHLSDRKPPESSTVPPAVLSRRIVRILNVSSNHYMVHLPVEE